MANRQVFLCLLLYLIARTLSQVVIDGPGAVNAHVFENSTEVVDFHATGGSITWSLNSTSNFTINAMGMVSVASNLDREAIPAPHLVSLTVTATSGSNSDSVVLTVSILDKNDNAPVFDNPTSNGTHDNITLQETEPVGSIVYTILASDPDYSSGGNFHFVLTFPDGYFLVGYLTGDIELNKALDFEQNSMHTLTIYIEDEGVPSLTATITITVNVTNEKEAACVFSQKFYYASIPEGFYSPMTPSTISTVTATDSDLTPGNVIKYYLATNPSNLFSIGLLTGVVSLSGSIDRETVSRYIISLSAQEYLPGGNIIADSPACAATVVLAVTDINDNSPTFYSGTYSGTVNENIELGHIVIATVDAFDLDQGSNAVFSYRIRDISDSKFQIHPTTGVINVTAALDYESGNINYQFIIEAYEPDTVSNPKSGTARVTVHVNDVNDHAPYFLASNYSFTILEEQSMTTLTPQLRAEDNDATSSFNTLSFTINGFGAALPNLHFQLISGGVDQSQLSTVVPLDRETVSSYHMIATASDNGPTPMSDTADIFVTVLDINDHPPIFDVSEYSLDLVEENAYPSCLTVHAEDTMDEAGPNTQVFYNLQVHSASPNISLTYLQSKFVLDSATGDISCFAINHEFGYHNIVLQVTATDAGTNPGPLNSSVLINVTVEDINEHPPVFTQATYNTTIYENHTVGSAIGVTVLATENGDAGLNHPPTYSIVSGNVNGAFSVDEDTGVFTLAHSLDWEALSPNPVMVKVKASDRYDDGNRVQSSTATVLVYVLDVNDNTPYIITPLGNPSFSISEGDLPRAVTTIQATDPDGNSDGTVTYDFIHPLYGNFTMNNPTGVLFMNTPPDRESIPLDTFTITLIARDRPPDPATVRTNTTYINILVTDVNDHPPVFQNTSLSANITEDTPGAVFVVQVTAVDNFDIGVNAEVEYFIDSISPNVILPGGVVKFQIDQTTGVLQTGSAGFDYDDSSDRLYTIVINARDKGTNPMRQTDTATVTVTITDVNDNAPVLSGTFFDHTINENYGLTVTPTDTVLITAINATDVDTVNGPFVFSVVNSTKTKGLFLIDAISGDIYIPSGTQIDREKSNNVIDAFGRAVVTFAIQVTDGVHFDLAEITIYIEDVNDQPPVFSDPVISTGVPENAPIGTVVDIVTATDADYGNNALITYSKTSGDPQGLFSVPDSSVGKIVVAGILDKENGPASGLYVITVNVTATDGAGHNNTVQVSVEITDTNDNSPVFYPTFYQVTRSEAATFDDVLEYVNATDADSGSNGLITYTIFGGNVGNAFYIKTPASGDVRVFNTSAIDRETLSFYRLIIIATDGAFPATYQRTTIAEFVVHISDVNDNTPQFLYFLHTGVIAENAINNTFVPVTPSVYATDIDAGTNAAIIYDIESGYPFRIDIHTGFIYTSAMLDRETIDYYTLTVHARDGGGRETTGILQVTITDINDNKPIINETSLSLDTTIAENYTIGGHIASITATDTDIGVNGKLLYSLTGGEGYFQVDANTGNVTLIQSLLSLERRSDFTITVKVNDGGIPSFSDQVTFRVSVMDVNDNAPVFTHSPATFTLPENAVPGILALDPGLLAPGVVTDADDGVNAQYDFYLSNDSSPVFSFDNSTRMLRLVQDLDYETKTLHTALIYVKDRGSPSLQAQQTLSIRLTVTDVNDQPPVFDTNYYSANVSEFTQSNVPLLLVSASDADSAPFSIITFHLTSSIPGEGNDLFKVGENTGLLLTKAFLDETTRKCYNLIIEAMNPDAPLLNDNATVYICVTDQNQSPSFDKAYYNFSINENEPAGYVFGAIQATDHDEGGNSVITFSLITDLSDQGFAIDNTTGVLTTLVSLDREDQDIHILTVIAKDMGQGSFQHSNYTTIIVNVLDENDNSPQFLHNTYDQNYTISEDIARNTTITTVGATDVDVDSIILFDIIFDPRTLFKIDHSTGVLQTEGGSNDFDREAFTSYIIIIQVYNPDNLERNSNASINFTLTDVNDNAPYFTSTPNNTCVYENATTGLLIGSYKANDADSGINAKVFYQIIGGNIGDAFSIDALSGSLRILNQLDYETIPTEYTLTIQVQDLGTPQLSADTTEITICILDVNDNGPRFLDNTPNLVPLSENQESGHFIVSFEVRDADSPPNDKAFLQLINGNDMGAFYFNETNFSLYVNNDSVLDYESGNNIFTLTILAVDATNPQFNDTASITIMLTDTNDNAPVLDNYVFNISLLESETVGAILGQILGMDADSGSNAQLSYHITNGDTNNMFSINSVTGTFNLSKALDYDTQSNYYNLTVIVSDNGTPSLETTAYIIVTVNDVNDNPPVLVLVYPSPLTTIDVAENTAIGYLVCMVIATDSDSGLGGEVIYQFSNDLDVFGTPSVFKLNSTSGEVILIGSLDRETKISYEVTVIAKDKGTPQFQDSIHLHINVTDVNDHQPSFKTPLFLNYYLPEDHPFGPSNNFTYMNGSDIDEIDKNNLYYYAVDGGHLSPSDCDSVFCVERNGKVYHHRKLDREIEAFHTLTVAISNSMSLTPTDQTVEELNLETLTLTVIVTDVNDNAPQFLDFETKIGISDDEVIGSRLLTVLTTDADVGNFQKVSYRIDTSGAAVVINRETGVITSAGSFVGEGGQRYTSQVEAYDNEGNDPSNSNFITLLFYVFDYQENGVILQLNRSVEYVRNNIEQYTRALENATGNQIVITDIRISVDQRTGLVDTSKADVVFIVINSQTNQPYKGSDVVIDLTSPNRNVTLTDILVQESPTIAVPLPPIVTNEGYPLWILILIIVGLGSMILLLCCAFCAFLINEKRRNRKLLESKSEISDDAFSMTKTSSEFNTTSNPLWISPLIMHDSTSTSSVTSSRHTVEKPNPMYEDQEVNLELFDDDDDDLPPLGSTENLIHPPASSSTLRGTSMTEDDLLDQAVGLTPMGSHGWDDDDNDDKFSFI